MNEVTPTPHRIGPALAMTIIMAACSAATGGSSTTGSGTTAVESPAASASTDTGATVTETVSANTASLDEIVAALESAAVTNADRWALEILEYRPYDTSDPTLQHLQDELAKYDPDAATLAAILSVLTP